MSGIITPIINETLPAIIYIVAGQQPLLAGPVPGGRRPDAACVPARMSRMRSNDAARLMAGNPANLLAN